MSKHGCILFDFDGVFVSTFDMCFEINHRRDPALTEEVYRRRFDGNINTETKKAALKQLPAPGTPNFFDVYTPLLLKRLPVPGMDGLVRSLAAKHDLSIVSSTISSAIRDFLEKHGLADCVSEIYGNEISPSKVEKIRMALEAHACDPKKSVFITDTLGDIREAHEAGVESVAVTWGFHDRETLEKGNPIAIVEDPRELEREIEKRFKDSP